jgi:hypothetical protein
MSKDEEDRLEGLTSLNQGFDGASALSVRLDTSKLLQDIEMFLRGKEENFYWNPQTNRYESNVVEGGMPKANKKGIQAILNYCRGIINPQVVQGNFDKKEWGYFIFEKRIEIAHMLIVSFYDWELKSDADITDITDFLMNIIEPFTSRLIDNKERESYAATIKTVESARIAGGNALFNSGGQQ